MSGWSRVQLTTSCVPCTMFSTPLQAACVNHLAHGPCAKCPLQLNQAGGEVQGIKSVSSPRHQGHVSMPPATARSLTAKPASSLSKRCSPAQTHGGKPACCARSASITAAPGSFSEGLSTKVLPAVTAMGNIHSGIMAGKLKGQMPAQTCSIDRSMICIMGMRLLSSLANSGWSLCQHLLQHQA